MTIQRPIVFFDIESDGLDVQESRIIELCMAKIFPGNTGEIDVKTRLVNPGRPIPKEASEIHGITDADVKDAPLFKQIAKGVLSFIEDCDLGGFNVNRYDIPLLYAEFVRAGITWDWKQHFVVDAHTIFTRKEERTLSAAYKFYTGGDIGENAHSAETDILATIAVFQEQVKKYELPDNVEEMDLYCNYDQIKLDLSGFFALDSEKNVIFTKGKHKDKKAINEPDYLKWMTEKGSFMPDTKRIAQQLIDKVFAI